MAAGTKAQGRRSVAIWLTSIYLASDRLHSSPLVQSLPLRCTLQTFRAMLVMVNSNLDVRRAAAEDLSLL